MKWLVAFVLLCGIGAQGQCAHADLAFIPTRCPCTGAIVFVDECQGTFGGQGCADAQGMTNFCGPTCAILTASGCIPGGPKLKISLRSEPLARQIRSLSATARQVGEQECIYDDAAFQQWLKKTNVSRLETPLKGIGN